MIKNPHIIMMIASKAVSISITRLSPKPRFLMMSARLQRQRYWKNIAKLKIVLKLDLSVKQ